MIFQHYSDTCANVLLSLFLLLSRLAERHVIRTRADKAVSADDCSIVSIYLSIFWKAKVDITGLA
jgi:hypothetical protein